ncbi:hypothetical protein CK203_104954 [Vitis vinifera]|uniref:Retrovirus-related Pol polyprotein from transposon RE1 n=1 Tax=Vitis vinifera TaxID=29760 RepID=A0A438BQA3_VITVI|nr:hypothetical protein CK203_104954 [Vitis vinifera]
MVVPPMRNFGNSKTMPLILSGSNVVAMARTGSEKNHRPVSDKDNDLKHLQAHALLNPMVVSSNASATFNLPAQVIPSSLMIVSSLSPSIVSTIYGLETSRLAWQALNSRFAAPSTSRISLIKRKLQSVQQGSMSCQSFLDEVNLSQMNYQQLANLLRILT